MYNLENCLSPKSPWSCFLVIFSLVLLFFSCTTTEFDQKRDQLAKRMTGGEIDKGKRQIFFARIYYLRKIEETPNTEKKPNTEEKPNTEKKPYTEEKPAEVLRTCAGAFIYLDLVLTALQCVLFETVYGTRDTILVQLEVAQKIATVSHDYENPKHLKDGSFKNGLPMYDVALLKVNMPKLHSRFMPIPPCKTKNIVEEPAYQNSQLKILGMTNPDRHFTNNGREIKVQFKVELVQEAQFVEVDPLKLFESVYKRRNIFILWEVQTKRKPQPLPHHRIAAFSEQRAELDRSDIGSPAFLYNEDLETPVCLYGVLSGFISGKQSDTFFDKSRVPKNAQTVTAVVLEGVFFYYEWLNDAIQKSSRTSEFELWPEYIEQEWAVMHGMNVPRPLTMLK